MATGLVQKKHNKIPATGHRQNERMQALLLLEAELRRQKTPVALSIWAVNEMSGVIDYSQCLLFRMTRGGKAKVMAVSNLAQVDRDAPFIGWVEKRVTGVLNNNQNDKEFSVVELELSDGRIDQGGSDEVYPFAQVVLVPLTDRNGQLFGALLFARSKQWQENEKIIAARLGETVSHCFTALLPAKKLRLWSISKKLFAGGALAILLAMFIRVPMTTLAPAEIAADEPEVVAAPIDGVLAKIFRDPNVFVQKGDMLFAFDNTELKANADISLRKHLVAEAKLATAKQAAFSDVTVYRQLAIAKAEVALALAEKQFSDEKLIRTIVKAQSAGQLIYTSRKEWVGKPLKTGERVMEIAARDQIVVKVLLPVADAIALSRDAKVRLFLDADPLKAWNGKMRHASYHATERPGVGLAYEIIVDLKRRDQNGENLDLPRIGLRGTAQIFGEKVFLGFYLFRRPISTIRQYFGI